LLEEATSYAQSLGVAANEEIQRLCYDRDRYLSGARDLASAYAQLQNRHVAAIEGFKRVSDSASAAKREILSLRRQNVDIKLLLDKSIKGAEEANTIAQNKIRSLEVELGKSSDKASASQTQIRELYELRSQCSSLKATIAALERKATIGNGQAATTTVRSASAASIPTSVCISGADCAMHKVGRCRSGCAISSEH
jgi:hypothetical protein